MITQARLKELFDYDAVTGALIRKRTGKIHSSPTSHGYVQIGIDGKTYRAHRLVWLWHYCSLPKNQIDHINRVRNDNRIENLRDITHAENHRNKSNQNKHGVGISPCAKGFTAVCYRDYKPVYLGWYRHSDLAKLAYALYIEHGVISKTHPLYTGVYYIARLGKWGAQTRQPNRKYIGTFTTREEALAAVKEYYK